MNVSCIYPFFLTVEQEHDYIERLGLKDILYNSYTRY